MSEPREAEDGRRASMERVGSAGSLLSAGSAGSAGGLQLRRSSSVGSPVTPSYSLELYHSFPQVCQKAKGGVQLCHAVASLLGERASVEQQYAQSLLKTAQHTGAEDWSAHLTDCWAGMLLQLGQLANERAAFASTLQTSIVPGVKAFAMQHESQVQRLISEGTKVRSAYQRMLKSADRSKEKYDRKCAEAADIASALRKADTSETPVSFVPPSTSPPASSAPVAASAGSSNASSSPPTSDAVSGSSTALSDAPMDPLPGGSPSKDWPEKITAGPGQLLTKILDTTSSFSRISLDRQRSKLDGCLEDVLVAEKNYVQAVEVMNAQRPIFENEIKENLHGFQLTEEQRLEYLKSVLVRTQAAFATTVAAAEEIVEQMRASAQGIDEMADIEQIFKQLGPQLEVDVNESDLSNNPFYNRVIHIQALSNAGHRSTDFISSTIMELTVIEDRYLQHLRKLLRVHEHGIGSSGGISTDLFGSSSSLSMSPTSSSSPLSNHSGAKFIHAEGDSMAKGWHTLKEEVQLLLEVHEEFRSLLSEPVTLSLETMKLEYETTCGVAQEDFVQVHSLLCYASSSHQKLRQKFHAKLREFTSVYATVTGKTTPGEKIDCLLDAERVLAEYQAQLQTSGAGVSDREHRVDQKLRQFVEEMTQLESQLASSAAELKDKFHLYVQDIEVFVSTYMKNERFRLQVVKSSLQSFAKALRHMMSSDSTVAAQALESLKSVDVSADISSFIEANRSPYQRSKRVVPAYHTDEVLREALRNYQRIPDVQAPGSSQSKRDGVKSVNSVQVLRPARQTDSVSPLRPKTANGTTASSDNGVEHSSVADNDQEALDEPMDTDDYIDLEDEGTEIQPLGVSAFQKKFNLSSPEQVVESYSCALYLSSFPYHGRLYLTRDHMCFNGWRDTIFVALLSEISSMEKKNTALIVPNAIELMVNGKRVFFASFLFRDECFQCIQQLRAIKIGTDAILGGKTLSEASSPALNELNGESLSSHEGDATMENQGDGDDIDSQTAAAATTTDIAENSASDESVIVVPPDDSILHEFELIMNEEAPFSVDDAYSTLWVGSDAFSLELLESAGSTNIQLVDWSLEPVTYAGSSTTDEFDASRTISYTHNKKYIVGPGVIPTTQIQRYKYSRGSRLIVSASTSISNVPYCDYFRVEHRWVFSATSKSNETGGCLIQVGIRVEWLKSTWLKKQIESTTVSESKDAIRVWFDAAVSTLEKLKNNPASSPKPLTLTADTDVVAMANATEKLSRERARSAVKATAAAATTVRSVVVDGGISSSFRSALQLLSLLCALLFLYALLRVCSAIEQMQVLTREMLEQQQQQQVLFREMLARLEEMSK